MTVQLGTRVNEMNGRFYYHALLNGYYMVPGENGIRRAGDDFMVLSSENLICRTLDEFTDCLHAFLAVYPKALP